MTVTVALPPETIVPSEQVKLGLPVHEPCEGVTVPRVNPAGHVSDKLTPVASDGPALVIVVVYVRTTPSPAVTVVAPSVLVMDRFALVRTVLESVAVLLVRFGSVVVVDAVALLTWGVAVRLLGTV